MLCLLIPIAFMVWMLAVFAVAFLPLRLPMGICRRCGYSLVGLGESGRCPECGTGFDQLRVQRLVPPWGSTGETLALFGIPAVAGGGAMVLCVACGSPSVLALAMGAALGPIAPAVVLIGLGLGRLPRGVVWGICLAGGLLGLLIGAAGFVAEATSGDAIGMMVVPVFGGVISALISGLIAGIAAMRLHWRLAELKRGGERRGREGSHG
jgi:hypothetical protein